MAMTRTIRLTASDKAPYIEQIAGSGKGRIFHLLIDLMSLGRTGENDIVIGSDSISRTHVYLKKTDKGWLLQDNNSRNGILINGKKTPEALLRSGDRFQVGDFVFRFVDPKAPAPAEAPPVAAVAEKPAAAPKAVKKKKGKLSEAIEAMDSVVALGGVKHGREAYLNLLRDRVLRPAKIYRDQLAYLAMGLTIGLIVASIAVRQFRKRHVPLPTDEQQHVSAPYATITDAPEPAGKSTPTAPVENPRPQGKRVTRDDLNIQKRGQKARTDKSELSVYLQEGQDYLREGDFESASIAFRFALVIEPGNRDAIQGLRTVEAKLGRAVAPQAVAQAPAPRVVRGKAPPVRAAAPDKRKQALDMLRSASMAYKRRAYQESINLAERARGISFKGNTAFVAEARSLIEQARHKQKEDFEPFLKQAKEKYQVGDFKGSRELCEEMLRLDPAYIEAASCVARAQAALKGKGK